MNHQSCHLFALATADMTVTLSSSSQACGPDCDRLLQLLPAHDSGLQADEFERSDGSAVLIVAGRRVTDGCERKGVQGLLRLSKESDFCAGMNFRPLSSADQFVRFYSHESRFPVFLCL